MELAGHTEASVNSRIRALLHTIGVHLNMRAGIRIIRAQLKDLMHFLHSSTMFVKEFRIGSVVALRQSASRQGVSTMPGVDAHIAVGIGETLVATLFEEGASPNQQRSCEVSRLDETLLIPSWRPSRPANGTMPLLTVS